MSESNPVKVITNQGDNTVLHLLQTSIGCKLIPETTFKRGYNE